MIDLLLKDLACYKKKALTLWQPNVTKSAQGVFCPATVGTYELFEEGYTHSKNVETRLSAIIYMLEACENNVQITAEQLELAWSILMDPNEQIPGDQNQFFRWLRRLILEQEWLSSTLVVQFFNEKILANPQIVKDIALDGFLAVRAMFLNVNEYENKLNIIKRPKADDLFKKLQIQTSSNYAGFAGHHGNAAGKGSGQGGSGN